MTPAERTALEILVAERVMGATWEDIEGTGYRALRLRGPHALAVRDSQGRVGVVNTQFTRIEGIGPVLDVLAKAGLEVTLNAHPDIGRNVTIWVPRTGNEAGGWDKGGCHIRSVSTAPSEALPVALCRAATTDAVASHIQRWRESQKEPERG